MPSHQIRVRRNYEVSHVDRVRDRCAGRVGDTAPADRANCDVPNEGPPGTITFTASFLERDGPMPVGTILECGGGLRYRIIDSRPSGAMPHLFVDVPRETDDEPGYGAGV